MGNYHLLPLPEQTFRSKEEELCYSDPDGFMVAEVGRYRVRMTNRQYWEIWLKMTRNERRTMAMQATIDHKRGRAKKVWDEELGKDIITNVPDGKGKVSTAKRKFDNRVEKRRVEYELESRGWIRKIIDKVKAYLLTWFD